ncbi:FxSxx-COOH system tetratricopeptide repeat protein [Actinoplanes sp. DH11]|uniref:FxSxx-COOH system tetratricopeptide repeat protein n=1 Tax=Actinoplanes sp. DH11 TaxID=2857011 RepID=UPI001E40F73A|nr:FxSxx-COOH system tetratricopeptide repeat protein [Actinoplanes sp. DH11]
MSIQSLGDPSVRSVYRREIANVLERPLSIPHDANNTELDLFNLVRGCEQEPQGLEALLEVVETFHPGAQPTIVLRRLIHQWRHEQRLITLMEGVPLDELTSAVQAVTGTAPPLRSLGAMVQAIGWQPMAASELPTILAVVYRLFAGSPGHDALQSWLEEMYEQFNLGPAPFEHLHGVMFEVSSDPQALAAVEGKDGDPGDPEQSVKRFVIEESPATTSPVRGGIPPRNLYFTGRDETMRQLEATLQSDQRASVLPETALQGYGGVGKTQIAIEYAYRNVDRYDLIWWMPSDDPAVVRAQLSVLATRLGEPSTGSMDQTVRSVLERLASTKTQRWLLVYDNANEPSDLDGLIPGGRLEPDAVGHVLITSRNPGWAASMPTLQVDVFDREESTDLLRKHRPDMSVADADRLAEVLGDLPLALEQAVTWLITTLTSVDDYLEEFERRKQALLSEGKPRNYPYTVLTFVELAVSRMRQETPVAAQLLALMAFLGTEPLTTSLLWEGRQADISEPLRSALHKRNDIARAVRDLVRFGLAKADHASRRITIHRLVQAVMREHLMGKQREEAQLNARRLLAAANPGYPDDQTTWARHAEIRPHVLPAGLIEGTPDEHQTVMDQIRYVFNTGDFEGCSDLCSRALDRWDKPVEDGGSGPNDSLTLLALRRYADALRSLGDRKAEQIGKRALDGMLKVLGESHEYTMGAVNSRGADLRIAGRMQEALELDDRNLERHLEVLGPGDPSTLRAMNSKSINLRWAGDFRGAYELDVEAERQARGALGELESWTFFAIESQARDLLLLGRYQEALDLQQSMLPKQIALLGESHLTVLRAQILVAAMLRKTGRIPESVTAARATRRSLSQRFGQWHGVTLSATQTLANTMRAAGDAAQALHLIKEARKGYQGAFGKEHPLSLVAAVNEAIIHRALGNDRDAMALDEWNLPVMARVLGNDHPFALALRTNYGTDLSRAHKLDEALKTSTDVWKTSARLRGAQHPYTLHAASNTALDMIQVGDRDGGEALHRDTLGGLELVYGALHPETVASRHYRRLECELEPPPT